MKQNCVTTTMDLLAGQGGRFVAAGSRRSPLTVSAWAVLRWVRNALP